MRGRLADGRECRGPADASHRRRVASLATRCASSRSSSRRVVEATRRLERPPNDKAVSGTSGPPSRAVAAARGRPAPALILGEGSASGRRDRARPQPLEVSPRGRVARLPRVAVALTSSVFAPLCRCCAPQGTTGDLQSAGRSVRAPTAYSTSAAPGCLCSFGQADGRHGDVEWVCQASAASSGVP
jgi:hypothetical protein